MFTQFTKKTAVNLITGSLGSGKTTLITQFLKQKPANESWAILVNEFGAIGIDGSILQSQNSSNSDIVHIKQIPGGCICCTAQHELKEAIEEIVKQIQPDRLFIEPTGLGEPDILVDLLQDSSFHPLFDIQTTFAVIDSTNLTVSEIKQYLILQNLFSMADVVVLNKQDIAIQQNLLELQEYANALFPAKTAIITTQQSKINANLLYQSSNLKPIAKPLTLNNKNRSHAMNEGHDSKHAFLPPLNIDLPGLVKRQSQQQLATLSIGWVFDPSVTFSWKALQTLFESFNNTNSNQNIKRAKGVFKVGKPWMLFQWVNNQSSREYIAYRRDSRLEILLPEQHTFDIQKFEHDLKNCIQTN
ncbi:GTP-binding protein [Thiomicrorhabdus hydrogeniphila]